jgi:hypothetical protein
MGVTITVHQCQPEGDRIVFLMRIHLERQHYESMALLYCVCLSTSRGLYALIRFGPSYLSRKFGPIRVRQTCSTHRHVIVSVHSGQRGISSGLHCQATCSSNQFDLGMIDEV